MKKTVAILLLLLVVGCGKDEYDTSRDEPEPLDPNQAMMAQLQGRYPPGMPMPDGWAGKSKYPFIDAVAKGDIEAVKKHLAAGADVNRADFTFGNPLHIAIESRYTNRREIVVELLLAKGADVNAENSRGWTPAESLKRTEGAMMLIGATPEQKADNIEIARLLLQHGAQTDADFKHLFPDATSEPTAEPETPDSTPPGEEAAADPADAP